LLILAVLSRPLAAAGPAEVKSLIAVLQRSDASLHDKARACQQLGEFGTKEAVAVLAALLNDQALGAYARSGLEGIPDPSAAAALRSALTTLKGDRLIGVINSLGAIRDAKAVAALARLASDPRSGVVKEALLALGRIAGGDAVRIVQRALSAGPESSRADAAAAALIAAEFHLAAAQPRTAIALYDAVRAANVPLSSRIGATRGAIIARKAGGIELLVSLLKSDDRETRNAALLTVREIPGDELAETLNRELESARPELQAQLIEAVADCHNSRSVQLARAKATSDSALVRVAAFRTLGKIGDRSDAEVLLKAVSSGRTPAESTAASASLARIESAEVDALILKTLTATADVGARVALIDLLEARSPAAATGELLRQAADPNPSVSLAALRAIRSTAGVREIPALIALTKASKDDAGRGAAEDALFRACTRTSDSDRAGEMVLEEFKASTELRDKASWIKTLAAMGYNKAVPAIAPSLRDSNPSLVALALDNLSKWPNPAPIDDLLGFVDIASDAGVRQRAMNGVVQLAAGAGNARQAPAAVVAAWFQRAGKSARSTQEKGTVVSGLGRWTDVESVKLLVPYLDDREVRTEAASAIVYAAGPVAQGPDYAILVPLLERISGMGNSLLTDRVNILKLSIAVTEKAMQKQQRKP
jgi:HEAT repeat protein